jgi:hypothetical protein
MEPEAQTSVETTTTEATPAPEPQTTDQSTAERVETDSVEQAAEAISETRHQPRAERRIRELARKNRELEQQQQYNGTPNFGLPPQLPRYEPGAEISPEQLQRDVAQAADGIAQLRVQQALAQYDQRAQQQQRMQQLESDVHRVEGIYPELNPDSDKYDSRLSSRVTRLYEKAAASNPTLRLSDFVADAMELAGAGTDRARSEVKNSLAKQAASGAVTPSSSRAGASEPDLASMTPGQRAKHLEKKLGFAK